MLGPAFVTLASKWPSAGCCDGTAEAQDDVDQGEPGFAMGKTEA